MVYLDNAATSGVKPRKVLEAVNNALINYSVNPSRGGYKQSIKASEMIFECRKKIKEFFNASSECSVCFTSSCTHAINTVLYGVLNRGDHVIISSMEHNAVSRTIYRMQYERDVEYSVANVDLKNDKNTVENFKRMIKPNTRMIVVTAASNVIGKKMPLKELGQLCKAKKIMFCVDGAQAAGTRKIDVKDMNIDYLCIAPHKGFYAPMGVGVLIAEKAIERVLITGGTGVNSLEFIQPAELPERIESGTVNLPGIAGVSAGIDFVNGIGIEKIEKYEQTLCMYAFNGLSGIGANIYANPSDVVYNAPVLSFNVKGFTSDECGNYLSERNIAVRTGLHCSPMTHKMIGTVETGTVRISPSVFNTREDINKLILSLKRII